MLREAIASLLVGYVLLTGGMASATDSGEAAVSTGALAEGTDVVTVHVEDHDSGATVSGVVRITIPGMEPYVMAGNLGDIEWVRDGGQVSGTIRNHDGNVITTINGQITEGEMGGTFFDASGRQGTWEWEGPIPE